MEFFLGGVNTKACNQIQFHHDMSIPGFPRSFSAEAIKPVRWPEGFRCPRCASCDHYVVGHGGRKRFQCNGCRHQTSLITGTLMAHTKLPLATWFFVIYLIIQATTRLSVLEFKHQLGVSYPTAWLLHQTINRVIAAHDATHQLSGTTQLDDAYLGRERADGKVGRGSKNDVPFVAAASVNAQRHPMCVKLLVVKEQTPEPIIKWTKANLPLGTSVHSHGLGCLSAVADAVCSHLPMVVGGLKPRDLRSFNWVNTVHGKLNTTLAGAFHALGDNKYAKHYLAGFISRHCRSLDFRVFAARLFVYDERDAPIKEKAITMHTEERFQTSRIMTVIHHLQPDQEIIL